MSLAIAQALTAVAADLGTVGDIGVVWKDADPGVRMALPPRCTRHGNAYCRAVKADPQRLARCIQADDVEAVSAGAHNQPAVHQCPFGVIRVAVPVMRQGLTVGTALLGPFAGKKSHAGLQKHHARLPSPPSVATMLALGRLAQAALRHALPHSSPALDPSGDPVIARALAIMAERPQPHMRAAAVARTVGLSTSRFLHRFAAACGEGFRARLTRIICARAVEKLTDFKRTVLSIAIDSGYGDEDAFATAFKRVYGMPPGRFRAKLAATGG